MSVTQSASLATSEVDTFVTGQNQNRGGALAGGGTLPLYYNALTTSAVAGENAASGIAGITANGQSINLPSGQPGNAVVFDGAISTNATTSGAHSYSLTIDQTGLVSATDNNTGDTESLSNASYLVFNGAATNTTGAYQSVYLIETGTNAQIAEMYNAAFGRVPDLAGLEYNSIPVVKGVLSLHDLAADFLISPEFANLYLGANGHTATIGPTDDGGPNDQAFISKLYGQILHRTPSAAEISFYVDALQGTLTTSTGAAIPAADRAQLLIYFSISPENQADVSATNGGWLINPANGPTSLGAMTTSTATTILTNELASGTVSASSFAGLPSTDKISVTDANGGNVTIVGGDYGIGTGLREAYPVITTQANNITINLSSQYWGGEIDGQNDTLNGPSSGGGLLNLGSSDEFQAWVNGGGTVNLSGNTNWVRFGNSSFASSVPAKVNGWNSTDIMVDENAVTPSYANSAATLLAHPDGTVLSGSASAPVNGAAISSGANAINVGTITDDSVAAIVKAANSAFHENGNTLTDNTSYSVYFFGEDPQGNTMIWYWRGDTNSTGTVQASDITGGIELVGVSASSLAGTNFHH